jgi:hypothetical protein
MGPEDRYERALEAIMVRLGNIDVTLGQQHVSLKEHMRRTDLLEAKTTDTLESVDNIKAHVTRVKYLGWLAVVIVPILVSLYTALNK